MDLTCLFDTYPAALVARLSFLRLREIIVEKSQFVSFRFVFSQDLSIEIIVKVVMAVVLK